MATWRPIPCNGNDGECKNEATKIIYIGTTGYGLCNKCYEWLGKVNQILLEDWGKKKE